jgi:DNA (cytosine-5)-methyltransferase 1
MHAVDLFAGAGGTSTGATMAGARIVAAVNHWPVAVRTHERAHPEAAHFCEDAAVLDPTTLPTHDLLLASPSCTGHTRARGVQRPHHDAARATAWCVLRVAEVHRPRVVVVENVPEMLGWVCYRGWRLALSDLGYRISEQVLDAADVGVPQHRRRLFVVAVRGRRPLALEPGTAVHVPAREALDLDDGPWSDVATKCTATRARIEAGRAALGDDFLAPYYGSGSGLTGRSLDRPIGTLTTKDRYALVRGDRMRMLTVREQLRLASFPVDYPLAGSRVDGVMQVGNSVPPLLARHVVAQVLQ